MDGSFGTVTFDRKGRIGSIILKSGNVLSPALTAEYRGIRWVPDSIVIAEVEIWTEGANRAAEARGYRLLHAFDAQRIGGRDLTRESYADRRDGLYRAHVDIELAGDDQPWLEDEQGDAHDPKTGRYTKPVPKGWRRVSIVPQMPITKASEAWSTCVDNQTAGPCEGLVAVATGAKLGARNAKRKVKTSDTIDCVVTTMSDRAMTTWWTAGQRAVTVSRPRSMDVTTGMVVELRHEGFHDTGEPRFARVVRPRPDLAG